MAVFLRKLVNWYGPTRDVASATFTTAGASNPTTSNLNGIASITRTGVGLITITMQDSGKEYNVQLTRQCVAANTGANVVVSSMDLSAKTIVVLVASGGVAIDLTGITVHVVVSVRRGN